MDFSPNKIPVNILEMFILILIKNGTKIHGKNLFS